jgi:hypothetical protein
MGGIAVRVAAGRRGGIFIGSTGFLGALIGLLEASPFSIKRAIIGLYPSSGSSPISGPRDRQLCREAIWGSGSGARNDPRVSGSSGCGAVVNEDSHQKRE